MPWRILASSAVLALASTAQGQAVSADVQRLLDAATWQLELQITFDATTSSQWPAKGDEKPGSERSSLHAEYQETIPLTTRSEGPSLTMQRLAGGGQAQDPAAAAQMQKTLLDLIMQSDKIVSWMTGGLDVDISDGADTQAVLAAGAAAINKPVGSMKFDYKSHVHAEDQYNEVGDHFNRDVDQASSGEAPVIADVQQIMFELNTVGKRVALTVPAILPIARDTTFQMETVTTFFPLPLGPKPSEERVSRETGPLLTQVELTDPATKFGQGSLFFDDPMTVAGGKLSAQHTVTATYRGMHLNVDPIPGKLVVKYTLTPR